MMVDEAVHFMSTVVASTLGQTLAYFAMTSAIYGVVWIWGRERFRSRRIQVERRAGFAQFRRETVNSAMSFAVATVTAVFILFEARLGHTRLITEVGSANIGLVLASGVAMVILNDAWFYWVHRLLHTRWFFRHVHHVHHRSVDVSPFSAYSFHPVEALLLSLWIVPWVFLVPTWVPVLAGVQLYGYFENLKSHLGYEFYPRCFASVFPLRWLTTSTYHNVHHTASRGNYALTFRWWDQWLGTEAPDHRAVFDGLPRQAQLPQGPAPHAARRDPIDRMPRIDGGTDRA